MLSVVYFGTSDHFSRLPLAAMARHHRVMGVVQPRPQPDRRRLRRLWSRAVRRLHLAPNRFERLARSIGVPCWTAAGRSDPQVAERLEFLRPDFVCIAGYPWILPPALFQAGRLGALNVHPSLLPRHRGAMPLLWTYLRDDREAGVSVHWVTESVDAGDLAGRYAFPLPRGCGVASVKHWAAVHGARLLVGILAAVERGAAPRTPQDERLVSRAPVVRPGTSMVDFAAWDVERVWHVLAGLVPHFLEPLRDAHGRPVSYDGVAEYHRTTHDVEPGTVRTDRGACRLFCRGGVVELIRDGRA